MKPLGALPLPVSKELTSFVIPALKIMGSVTRKCVLFCFIVINLDVGYFPNHMILPSFTYPGSNLHTQQILDFANLCSFLPPPLGTHYFPFFFFFLGPNVWHMEVPRLQVESELQLLAYVCHSPSNTRSESRLRPTAQLMAVPDPRLTDQGQGLNPHPHG